MIARWVRIWKHTSTKAVITALPERTELPDDVLEAIHSKMWDLYEDCKES